MAVTFHNINIPQGSKFEMNVQALNSDKTVKDLTGYDARMQIRQTVNSVSPLLSITTGTGEITINAPGGIVMVRIPATTTIGLTFNDAVYDIEIYKSADPTEVSRIVEGFASLSLEVTR